MGFTDDLIRRTHPVGCECPPCMRATIERLRELLAKYGQHGDECFWYLDNGTYPCVCGFAEALRGGE
jgi:hypothetical protein